MEWFTIILLVPPAEAVAYGEFYLAHARAQSRASAVAIAQMDACDAYGMLKSRADEWPALIAIKGQVRDCHDLPSISVNGKEIRHLHVAGRH